MIRINLLPPELCKTKTSFLFPFLKKKFFIGAGSFLAGLTFIFYVQYQVSSRTLKNFQSHWVFLQKDIQRVSDLQSKLESGSKKEKEFLERYVTSPLPLTVILNAINQFLPDSMWLIEMKVTRKPQENNLLLKGFSVPTNRSSSIQDIEKYLRDLKAVFPSQTELILTTSRQTKEDAELTLFTAVFKWT